jgi:para-nitrobenzyl esterase
VVESEGGPIVGVFEAGLNVFRGIPFAAPPTGHRRWRPPARPLPWEGTRDGADFGAVCPQVLRPGYSKEVLAEYPMEEDCLTLNIWSPGDSRAEEPKPVMVWILPGSFRVGAAQMPRYTGAQLAKQGVVVVTFNYRLGLLGQFAHPALSSTAGREPLGNYGLMDQVAALEWVQRNIAQFGGNPSNVTIFGMSAGGVSVNYLMTTPASKGLFHRAASQSSAISISAPRLLAQDTARAPSLETEGAAIAEKLGIAQGPDEDVAAKLRALPVNVLLDYQANNRLGNGGSLNPVVDGRFIRESVGAVFDSGREHPVPYLTGATSWEGSLVSFFQSADPLLQAFGIARDQAKTLYGDAAEAELINNIETDFFFGSQHYLAKRHTQNGHPAYVYFFSRIVEAHEAELPGAAHGSETRYVFRTLDSLSGPASMPQHGTTISVSDRSYADLVSSYWVAFASNGDPNGSERPEWPRFNLQEPKLLEFAQQEPIIQTHFRKNRMAFFEKRFAAGEY